jgi:hypothetical protein
MIFKVKIFFALIFLVGLNAAFGQKRERDTTFIAHLTYFDPETLPGGPNNYLLCWQAKQFIPNTYFVIEHFCWGKWIKRRKITETSILGKREYFGKTGNNCQYKFRIPPHSGENRMRILLMNDSNVCLAISRELKWVSIATVTVTYTDKQKLKEIQFNNETDYEILDSKGALVKGGRGSSVSYADLDSGTYTLNYDNSSTLFTKKE